MKEETGRGYSAALGVFLAYTALEAYWTASGEEQSKGFIDPQLAGLIRAALKSGADLADGLTSQGLKKRVVSFLNGDVDDVLVFARALRNLVAHGIFTPWGAHSVSLKAAMAFDDLAQCLLRQSDSLFRRHRLQTREKL